MVAPSPRRTQRRPQRGGRHMASNLSHNEPKESSGAQNATSTPTSTSSTVSSTAKPPSESPSASSSSSTVVPVVVPENGPAAKPKKDSASSRAASPSADETVPPATSDIINRQAQANKSEVERRVSTNGLAESAPAHATSLPIPSASLAKRKYKTSNGNTSNSGNNNNTINSKGKNTTAKKKTLRRQEETSSGESTANAEVNSKSESAAADSGPKPAAIAGKGANASASANASPSTCAAAGTAPDVSAKVSQNAAVHGGDARAGSTSSGSFAGSAAAGIEVAPTSHPTASGKQASPGRGRPRRIVVASPGNVGKSEPSLAVSVSLVQTQTQTQHTPKKSRAQRARLGKESKLSGLVAPSGKASFADISADTAAVEQPEARSQRELRSGKSESDDSKSCDLWPERSAKSVTGRRKPSSVGAAPASILRQGSDALSATNSPNIARARGKRVGGRAAANATQSAESAGSTGESSPPSLQNSKTNVRRTKSVPPLATLDKSLDSSAPQDTSASDMDVQLVPEYTVAWPAVPAPQPQRGVQKRSANRGRGRGRGSDLAELGKPRTVEQRPPSAAELEGVPVAVIKVPTITATPVVAPVEPAPLGADSIAVQSGSPDRIVVVETKTDSAITEVAPAGSSDVSSTDGETDDGQTSGRSSVASVDFSAMSLEDMGLVPPSGVNPSVDRPRTYGGPPPPVGVDPYLWTIHLGVMQQQGMVQILPDGYTLAWASPAAAAHASAQLAHQQWFAAQAAWGMVPPPFMMNPYGRPGMPLQHMAGPYAAVETSPQGEVAKRGLAVVAPPGRQRR